MGDLVDNPKDEIEGSRALVVADDEGLHGALPEALRELGYAVTLRSSASVAYAALGTRESFALALLCVGRGTPEQLAYVARVLASPALTCAHVLLGTTALASTTPVLPDADRAASIAYLHMPFSKNLPFYAEAQDVFGSCFSEGSFAPVSRLTPALPSPQVFRLSDELSARR